MPRFAILLALSTLFGAVDAYAQPDPGQPALPQWLGLRLEERGRFEGLAGLNYQPGRNDGFLLNRLRLDIDLLPANWLRFHIQAQDSRAAGHRPPTPSGAQDPFDLRLAFVEIGRVNEPGWFARGGRQALSYGDQRLIGGAEWSNVPRSFDAVLLGWRNPSVRLEWFAASLAVPDSEDFDRFRDDDRVAGFYAKFQKGPERRSIEPYFYWTATRGELSETGAVGGKHVYTAGARFHGPLPRDFDYTAEAAFQTGDQAGDNQRAFATAIVMGRTFSRGIAGVRRFTEGVRLFTEYDYASGDDDPSDGRIGTFDNLYPTNHGIYGIVDRQGWRNMHGIRFGAQKSVTRWWRLQVDYHSFWLANRNDFLYWANGTPAVRNPDASSRHAGQELDFQNLLDLHRAFSLNIGYGHMFPGRFLKESTSGSPVTFAYAQFVFRFLPD